MKTLVRGSLGLLTISLLGTSVFADDWPQWLGPKRDGVWRIKIHRYIPEWTKVVPYEGNAAGEGYLEFMPLRALRGREDASYEWFA